MKIFGALALILGIGDTFHLVPRILSQWNGNFQQYQIYLGSGEFVTSITMTIFYVLLYYLWEMRYGEKNIEIKRAIFWLACLRIVICLCPQNHWLIGDSRLLFGILRNIPFIMLGTWIGYLFYLKRKAIVEDELSFMWIAITLSFLFYLPVVLLVKKIPAAGMFMIPKTLAYIWMIQMIYRFFKCEQELLQV